MTEKYYCAVVLCRHGVAASNTVYDVYTISFV